MPGYNHMRTYTVNVDARCHAIMSPCGNNVVIALPRRYVDELIADGFMSDIMDTYGLTMTANARGWIAPGSNVVMGRSSSA